MRCFHRYDGAAGGLEHPTYGGTMIIMMSWSLLQPPEPENIESTPKSKRNIGFPRFPIKGALEGPFKGAL